MGIQRLGIIGAGTTGSTLAFIAAQRGLPVILIDASRPNLEKAVARIRALTDELIERKMITDNKSVLDRIGLSLDLQSMSKMEVVVETIPDQEELKRQLLIELDRILHPEALLMTSVRSSSVTKLASATGRTAKVVGLSFIPPFADNLFIQIVSGLLTSQESLQQAVQWSVELGLKYTVCRDAPGFIHHRLLLGLINEAILLLQERVADADAVDKTFQWGFEAPLGPLALADSIGLDRVLEDLRVLHRERNDSRYFPAALLVKYVDAGFLGKKTGRGFFEYQNNK